MKFVIETQRECGLPGCRRRIDAVRVADDPDRLYPGLRLSRHFKPGTMVFCAGSLAAVEKGAR